MRILILSHYFPPEVNAPASRIFDHARAWVQAGHEVTVLTCVPNHPHGRAYPSYRNNLRRREVVEGIEVIRLWTYLTPNKGFIRRILNYLIYAVGAVLSAPFLRRYDVTLSTSPQFFCGLAGYFVSRIKRTPWVLEIRDLWPESIAAVSAVNSPRLLKALTYLERFAYRQADRIVSVTDSFVDHIAQQGSDRDKIHVIKNGVNLELFNPEEDGQTLRQSLGLEGKFVASYVGTHGMAHKLEQLLQAAKLLQNHPRIVIILAGDGARREQLLRLRDEWNLTNVLMLEQQPKEMMPQLWGLTDVSLVVLSNAEAFTKVIPSKLFEAMAMGVPIVLALRGEAQALVESAGAGLVVPSEDATAIAEAVSRLADNSELRSRLGASGRTYVRQHFDRRMLAVSYLELLESLTSEKTLSPASMPAGNL